MERNVVRAGTVNMLGGIRGGILALCVGVMMAQPAYADTPTFADLLEQAKAQAATGHRWSPPGDNMTETVMKMMDLIPTATPAEIAQLSALLESDKSGPPPLPPLDATTDERPAESALAPAAPATETPPPPPPATESAMAPAPAPPAAESALAPIPPAAVQAPPPQATAESALAPIPPAAVQAPPPRAAAESALAPAPPTPSTLATAAPTQLSALPDRPGSGGSRQRPPNQIGPSHIGPSAIVPSSIDASPTGPTPRDHAAALFARGLDAEIRGDLSGARRYYLVAAKDGDAAAARNLGRLYDPAYLKQTAIGGVDPDAALAREWYERAFKLGDPEAGLLLEALSER